MRRLVRGIVLTLGLLSVASVGVFQPAGANHDCPYTDTNGDDPGGDQRVCLLGGSCIRSGACCSTYNRDLVILCPQYLKIGWRECITFEAECNFA